MWNGSFNTILRWRFDNFLVHLGLDHGVWGRHIVSLVAAATTTRSSTGWYIVAVWLYGRTEWDPWSQLICVRWILIKTTKPQTLTIPSRLEDGGVSACKTFNQTPSFRNMLVAPADGRDWLVCGLPTEFMCHPRTAVEFLTTFHRHPRRNCIALKGFTIAFNNASDKEPCEGFSAGWMDWRTDVTERLSDWLAPQGSGIN